MQNQSELKDFYNNLYKTLQNDIENLPETSTIFKKDEKCCLWFTKKYSKNIPLHFNFLNCTDIEMYINFLSNTVLDTRKRKPRGTDRRKSIDLTSNRSFEKKIDPTKYAEQKCDDYFCNYTINVVNYKDFKNNTVACKLLIKSYAKILYTFGIVLDDLSSGKLKKITENCYTFCHGQQIIDQLPEISAICFTIVLVCLFLHGFEKHCAELFMFFANESPNLNTKFVEYWTQTHTVFIMSKLISLFHNTNTAATTNAAATTDTSTSISTIDTSTSTTAANINKVESKSLKEENNKNQTTNNNSLNCNSIIFLENTNKHIDSMFELINTNDEALKKCDTIFFNESYFRYNQNRLFENDPIDKSELCDCGIRFVSIVQKKYIEYTKNYIFNSKKSTVDDRRMTARAKYLKFLCKENVGRKRKYDDEISISSSMLLLSNNNSKKQTQNHAHLDKKLKTNDTEKQRSKTIRYVQKGQLNRKLPLYLPPKRIQTCIFWNSDQTFCKKFKLSVFSNTTF